MRDLPNLVLLRSNPKFTGVTHLAGPDALTWFAFAKLIMSLVGTKGVRTAAVDPITTADYPTAAARPANTVAKSRKNSSSKRKRAAS